MPVKFTGIILQLYIVVLFFELRGRDVTWLYYSALYIALGVEVTIQGHLIYTGNAWPDTPAMPPHISLVLTPSAYARFLFLLSIYDAISVYDLNPRNKHSYDLYYALSLHLPH